MGKSKKPKPEVEIKKCADCGTLQKDLIFCVDCGGVNLQSIGDELPF